jgi:hypothetical protein
VQDRLLVIDDEHLQEVAQGREIFEKINLRGSKLVQDSVDLFSLVLKLLVFVDLHRFLLVEHGYQTEYEVFVAWEREQALQV